jgi:seryl-tRNA synthetase
MNDIQKLQNLLENEFLPDLEVAIDELFAEIDKAKNATKAQKDELEELREMRTECFAIIEEIKKDELPLEEATELLAELVELKVDDI